MEVQITHGPLKHRTARVLGSRLVRDELVLDVETLNQSVNTRVSVYSKEVRELQYALCFDKIIPF